MAFRHGVYTSEVPTSILPSRSVDSNVVVAVGTAAVHTLAAGKPVYVNKPRMFYSYDEVVSEMGWDATHFSDYTLQELAYSHFALYRGAPLVLINVFDPAKHKTSVADEAVTLADGVAVLAHEYVANVRVSAGATMQTTHSVDNEAVTLSSGTGRLAHENVSNVVVSEETDGVDNILDEGTDYTLDAASGVITRLDTGGISSPNATLNVNYSYAATEAGTAVLAEGTDYALNAVTGEISRIDGGAVAADATLHVAYDYADVSRVTSADIIGGIDADGNSLGWELLDNVFPLFRVVPGSLLCPRYGEDPAVAVIMAAKAQNINGLFNAIAMVDIPSSGPNAVRKYTEVPAYKQNNNLSDPQLLVCWPKVKLGDMVFGLATQLTGLMSKTDYENGGIPYESASNKNLSITSIGYEEDDGSWKELSLGMEKVNYLNGEGIFSALNWDGGLRSWGGRMSCYPTNTDPKDCQEPIRRMFNWYRNTFVLTYFQKVDSPLTRRFIQTILKSEQIRLDGYTAREILLGGSISFEEPENPVTDLIDGIVRFHIRFTPPPAARDIEAAFEFDVDNLSVLFS